MNKNGKRAGKAVGVGLGLLLLLGGAYLVMFYMQTREMKPVETKEISDGVYAVKDDFVNLFLIRASDAYIAVDAGNTTDHIQKELNRLNIDPKKVAAVFLTHSDADHTAGLGLFPNAVIYLSKKEEQMIDGRTARLFMFKNKIHHTVEFLEDNQSLTVSGMTIKGIPMPGHTPGSMSFLVNDGLLFAGDAMGLKDGKVTAFNDIFNMDSKTHENSLTMLSRVTGIKYIFTAHYGATEVFSSSFDKWKD